MKMVTLAAIILSLSCPGFAASGEGGWQTVGTVRMAIVTRSYASDGLDDYDHLATTPPFYGWMAGSYHSVDEWGDAAGLYGCDERAPLVPGQTKTWMLYIWGVPGRATQDFGVACSNLASSDPLVHCELELVQKPAGVTAGPALGTVWTTPPSITLPRYTTNDGLTGYGFKFTMTMVPEPSALAAILGGLGCLLALHRRKG